MSLVTSVRGGRGRRVGGEEKRGRGEGREGERGPEERRGEGREGGREGI